MFQTQVLQSFALPHVAHTNSSYPEGNFRGNQLLDGSISLSPLYSCLKNDLHVSISAVLQQNFSCLQPAQAQFTIFRVPTYMLKRAVVIQRIKTAVMEHQSVNNNSISLCRRVYNSKTRTYVRLLGPCFKTGQIKPFRHNHDSADSRKPVTKNQNQQRCALKKKGKARETIKRGRMKPQSRK